MDKDDVEHTQWDTTHPWKMWNTHIHTHTHTHDYYSPMEENEIMPFAAA